MADVSGSVGDAAGELPVVDLPVVDLPLVDHHCHGVVTGDLDRAGFEALISEGGAPPPGLTNFDTPVGMAIRRHCAPVLDLPPHAAPDVYVARRAELGAAEVNRRFLASTGTAAFGVDTGFRPDGLAAPAELAALAGGAAAHEVVRLEAVAEAVAADGVEPDALVDAVAERLAAALAGGAIGFKTVAAYRVGLDVVATPPPATDVTRAAASWLGAGPGPGGWRLADPLLTRALLGLAVDLGRPIQVHVGFGVADIRMHLADPSRLTDWLHTHRVPVMLLHCWPWHRQAAYLAAVHPHVYLDLGLTMTYAAARAGALLEEALELAPFGKLLYSSDAFGVAEFYHLGASAFRGALGAALAARVASGEWPAADADRVAALVAWGNACRVYGLPVPSVPSVPS
jgi:predicted TIM-barrel fold metal-dependent hydrolase